MMTWRLWQALNRPTALAVVYQRLHLWRTAFQQDRFNIPSLHLLLALVAFALPAGLIFLGVPFLFTLFSSLLPNASIVIIAATTVFGVAQCGFVSARIAREHMLGVYDVLGVCLPGRLGIHWMYAANWLHEQRIYRWLLFSLVIVATFAALLGTIWNPLPSPVPRTSDFGSAAAAIILMWLDYTQTLVLSSLTAMLVPVYTHHPATARLYAAATFLTLQVGIITVLSFISLGFRIFSADMPALQTGLSAALLLVTYSLREGIIVLLWRQLVRTLNAKPSELDALTRKRL